MKFPYLLLLSLLVLGVNSAFAQSKKKEKSVKDARSSPEEKRIGIARIQIFASPAKGTSISEIANMPVFFGPRSEEITYNKKIKFADQVPPTTGDSIRDLTSDSLAVYFKTDLYSMSGYGDVGGTSKGKRNMIHDLPTENPQKLATDTVFDEAIDIACYWTFVHNEDRSGYIPTVIMKMEIYDKTGQARPEKSITLLPNEISTAHFGKRYGLDYDFVKGIKTKEIEKGGIAGNVIADVYLQALNKLLAKNK
jgi:hypothetical protein